jgi:hypothetical protein
MKNQPLPPLLARFPIEYIYDRNGARYNVNTSRFVAPDGIVNLLRYRSRRRPSQSVNRSFIVLGDLYRTCDEFHEDLMQIAFTDLCNAISHTPMARGASLMFNQDVYNKLRNISLTQVDRPGDGYVAYATSDGKIVYNISNLAAFILNFNTLDVIYVVLMHELLHIVYGHCDIMRAYMQDKLVTDAPPDLQNAIRYNINLVLDAFVNSSTLNIFRRLGEAYHAKDDGADVGNVYNFYIASSIFCKKIENEDVPNMYKVFRKQMITKDKLENILKRHGIIEEESIIGNIPLHVIIEKVILKTKEYYDQCQKTKPLDAAPPPPNAATPPPPTARDAAIKVAITDRERFAELRTKLGRLLSMLQTISDSEVIQQAAKLFQQSTALNPYGLSSTQREALKILIEGLSTRAQRTQMARGFAQALKRRVSACIATLKASLPAQDLETLSEAHKVMKAQDRGEAFKGLSQATRSAILKKFPFFEHRLSDPDDLRGLCDNTLRSLHQTTSQGEMRIDLGYFKLLKLQERLNDDHETALRELSEAFNLQPPPENWSSAVDHHLTAFATAAQRIDALATAHPLAYHAASLYYRSAALELAHLPDKCRDALSHIKTHIDAVFEDQIDTQYLWIEIGDQIARQAIFIALGQYAASIHEVTDLAEAALRHYPHALLAEAALDKAQALLDRRIDAQAVADLNACLATLASYQSQTPALAELIKKALPGLTEIIGALKNPPYLPHIVPHIVRSLRQEQALGMG